MDIKTPGSPDSHDYDELAHNNLRKVFKIGSWIFSEVKSIFSGIEYGKDWLMQYKENGKLTLNSEFLIQSKTTGSDEKNGYLKIPMTVAAINYLRTRPHPVLIHGYQRDKDVGYWIWLKEWYFENKKPGWQPQNTVTVNIPTKNILNDESVEMIHAKVRQWHRSLQFWEQGNFGLNLGGEIANFAVDEEANKILQQALDMGVPAEFPVLELELNGLLDRYRENIGNIVETRIRLFSLIPDESFPLKIEFLDGNEKVILEVPYVQMKKVQLGRKIEKWRGVSTPLATAFDLIHSIDPKNLKLQMPPEENNHNPLAVKKHLELVQISPDTKTVRFTNLETQKSFDFKDAAFDCKPIAPEIIRLVNSLATIVQELDVNIPIPEKIVLPDDLPHIEHVEKVASMLNSGIMQGATSTLTDLNDDAGSQPAVAFTAENEVISQIIEDFDENGFVEILIPGEIEVTADVFGHELILGKAEQIVRGVEIDRSEKVREWLDQQGVSYDLDGYMALIVDTENSYIRLKDWPREKTGTDKTVQ
jgi:hypothetical protein